jgi:hypothetical protein
MAKKMVYLERNEDYKILDKNGNWIEPKTMGNYDYQKKTVLVMDQVLVSDSKKELFDSIIQFEPFKKMRVNILFEDEDFYDLYDIREVVAEEGYILYYNDLTEEEIDEIELKYHEDDERIKDPIIEFHYGGSIISSKIIHPKCQRIGEGFLFGYYFI